MSFLCAHPEKHVSPHSQRLWQMCSDKHRSGLCPPAMRTLAPSAWQKKCPGKQIRGTSIPVCISVCLPPAFMWISMLPLRWSHWFECATALILESTCPSAIFPDRFSPFEKKHESIDMQLLIESWRAFICAHVCDRDAHHGSFSSSWLLRQYWEKLTLLMKHLKLFLGLSNS